MDVKNIICVIQMYHRTDEKFSGIYVTDDEGDGVKRIERCMELTNNLIDKGIQIKVSIVVREEMKVLFEPIKMKFIEKKSKTEKIEDKT